MPGNVSARVLARFAVPGRLCSPRIASAVEVTVSRVATFVIFLTALVMAAVEHSAPVWHYRTVGRSSPPNHIAVIGDSYTAGTD